MKFVNNTKNDSKIKIMDRKEKLGFRWITAKVGAEVDIPKEIGERERFTPVNGKSIIETITDKLKPDKKDRASTKPDDKDSALSAYKDRLRAIDGIGARIVEDVINSYPSEDILTKAINSREHLPFRNDISEKLSIAFATDSAPEDDTDKKEKDDE